MTTQKTPLYDLHIELGAKMVEFADYWMPVQYSGIVHEHKTVRNAVGIFDVSHMGEFFVSGQGAESYLQKLTLNDVSNLEPGKAQYTAMCYEDAGLIDDLILYQLEDQYMAIVNASNRNKNFEWMQKQLMEGVRVEDKSDEMSLFAVQGRYAEKTLQKITKLELDTVRPFRFGNTELAGCGATVARTGYTGEDGFEIAVSNTDAAAVWQAILSAGQEFGIEPIGLGARDTLRMEMKYCLYGNDIDETTNPIEAGLGWITKMDKGDFIARGVIAAIKEAGPAHKLVGIELKERGIARHGYPVVKNNEEIGRVTSGTFSPTLEKSIAIAYIDEPHSSIGTEVAVSIRGRAIAADVVKTPFYQRDY